MEWGGERTAAVKSSEQKNEKDVRLWGSSRIVPQSPNCRQHTQQGQHNGEKHQADGCAE